MQLKFHMKTVNSEVKMTTYTIQLVTQPTPPQLDRIMAIWLQGNLQAHDFIPADYWTGNMPLVRDQISLFRISVIMTSLLFVACKISTLLVSLLMSRPAEEAWGQR